jgi:tRNA(Ile)-lysidine synthase
LQGVTPQNRHITSLTHEFLNVQWDRKKPLLLGYSGGPDSKALLYSLLECDVVPHIAHVDHGWREESRAEADHLEQEALRLGCPFFSIRLDLRDKKEDEARKARYAFFSSLISKYEALLLAHQADDLAETVLKRIFEGAHLSHLGGMQPVSHQYGMKIWRPFLDVRKTEILRFLEERSLQPIIDPSNSDSVYLRSRMRQEIFPFLNERFGKEVTENLTLLSKRSIELRGYLDRQIAPISVQRGPWGVLIDLNQIEPIEQRHILLNAAKDESLVLSRDVLETLLTWISEKSKSKFLMVKSKKILVDQGRVWIFSVDLTDLRSVC